VTIEQCDNSTQVCGDPFDIEQIITQYIDDNQYIIASFLYLNTGFNANDKEPIVRFLDTSIWLTFTMMRGTEAFVEIGTFEMKSDTNFLPWEDETINTGTYIANYKTAAFEISLLSYPIYVQLIIKMSTQSK
jgi:hypothetical protein